MTRFVFFETPREVVQAAAPLYAELAAMRMRVALAKLMLKYSPDQPCVPAGSPEGGQWTDAGRVRVAGGFEDDEEENARRGPAEDILSNTRQNIFDNSVASLRRLEPNNPYLQYLGDGTAPSWNTVQSYQREVEAARARVAEKIAAGHAFSEHADEFDVTSRSEFADIARQTISAPDTQVRDLEMGRTGYYNIRNNTVVFVDPSHRDGGTMFKPARGQQYFDAQRGRK